MTRTLLGLLIVAVGLTGCGTAAPGTTAEDNGGGGASGEEPGGSPPDLPPTGARFGVINARIRNFTDLSADVTLRFSLFAQTVRLTVLRVPAHTSTNVIGPEEADLLEVSGVAEDGTPLPEFSFRYGVDFFAGTEAVYIIGTEEPPEAAPPTLIFLEPIEDVDVAPGEPLEVVIADEDPDSAAMIDFYLDPVDSPAPDGDGTAESDTPDAGLGTPAFGFTGNEIALATGLAEDLDADGDSFSFTLPEDLPLGDYRLVGVITDDLAVSIVRAPGLVQVTEAEVELPPDEEANAAPALELLEPAQDGEVLVGETLAVAWSDNDPDDNALIAVYLDPDDTSFNGDEFPIALDIEEDPDDEGDSAEITLTDVPPGTYRVIALITDGTSSLDVAAPGEVTVTAAAANDPPTISLTAPADDVTVALGESLVVAWEDSDEDDPAEISFYLDPDNINLNGNEVLVATFDEDPEGAGSDDGQIEIAEVEPGAYWLLAVISDAELLGFARTAGVVTVESSAPQPGGG